MTEVLAMHPGTNEERHIGPLLVIDEICDLLRVNRAGAYRLVREGRLDGVVVHLGRQVRFDRDALVRWIASGGCELQGDWREELPRPAA
jgi:excisionase family DNA binding protein